VERPSPSYTEYNPGKAFRVSVPSNWRELPASASVTFAPDGAYGHHNGQSVFTHGVELGLARNDEPNLRTATDDLIHSLSRSNPRMSKPSGYRAVSVDGRRALQSTVRNISEVTAEPEVVRITTTLTPEGTLLYAIAVAPQDEYSSYQQVFARVIGSIRMAN
jgi:hypothetical protein